MNLTLDTIEKIKPQSKDIERVENFSFYKKGYQNWFYGNGAPIASNASKQAKLITDPIKLIRRAKAVVARWGTHVHYGYSGGEPKIEDVWGPFEIALSNIGLDKMQIQVIKNYKG